MHRKSQKKTKGRFLSIFSPSAPFHYVEAYKSFRTNLKFITKTSGKSSFVVTSAIPEESKSSTVINLAAALALDGQKVIVVDCDLRRPVLHKYLKCPPEVKGLTDVMAKEISLEDCIISVNDTNLHVLVAGVIPPNPSEVLSSGLMGDIVEQLKEKFDYVILDAPPVSVVTDAAILGGIVDGAILVVRSKYADIRMIKLAQQKLEEVGTKIIGTVLTRYNVKNSIKKSGYSYSTEYEYYND